MIILLSLLFMLMAALFVFTRLKVRQIEARYPPIGRMVDVGGYALHVVHVAAPAGADLPPLVFVHGASGNLRDQMAAFLKPLAGRAEMLFVDRPGHGYSERGGSDNDTPGGQARSIAAAMRKLGIDRAILVGHSFGGAITASFALEEPEMTAGLVFLAPATHPWPGGLAWYYGLTATPVIGQIFANTLALPAGLMALQTGVKCVFAPNPLPASYLEETAPALVLRPGEFRANAIDVDGLKAYVAGVASRYTEIAAPTVIITGDSDPVVLADIHSTGLDRDIADSELVWVENMGHKPDYVATDLAIAAIEKVAGRPRDLQAMARAVGRRIAADDVRCGPAAKAGFRNS
ncbi:pimeloyl-ACP methyl ester carboxylesterase [Hoeflea marina]|uniref:Pimeloyl-ACP methyl ester carboxylesterase n=1 Tax=Hoeflea marina TaxID=274592 RepID=A0A317PDH8_9HYPH|nr:alpha/beta hydrolase [Hoeflea marina]PWV97242.1 pimeloyl-ACP methyl ester carboxylesterase [Hoeflea marina]